MSAPIGSKLLVAAFAALLWGGPAFSQKPGDTVEVTLDHAKIVRLPQNAQTVVVGNPGIADVSLQKNGIMVVTGKAFGVTNLIALDAGGALLAESFLRVRPPADNVLTVQRGLDRESYSCNPVCQPTLQLGDGKEYFDKVGAQAGRRNSFARGTE